MLQKHTENMVHFSCALITEFSSIYSLIPPSHIYVIIVYQYIYETTYSFIYELHKWSCVLLLKVTTFIGSENMLFMSVLSSMLAKQVFCEFMLFIVLALWVRTYVFPQSTKLDNNRFLFCESKLPYAITIKTSTHTRVETVLFRGILPCVLV